MLIALSVSAPLLATSVGGAYAGQVERAEAVTAEDDDAPGGPTTDVDPFAETLAEAPRRPPAEPGGEDVEKCLDSAEAHSAEGRVYNRFLWCQRWQITAARIGGGTIPRPEAEVTINYSAVAYGRDDGQRGVRVFFRGDDATYFPTPKGYLRPTSMLTQGVACPGTFCLDSVPASKKIEDWMGVWTRFDISSDASSGIGPDQVSTHRWTFTGFIVDDWNFVYPDLVPGGSANEHMIRCDSATYFGTNRTGACVFDEVTPRITYSVNDSRVNEVAEHIRCAQDEPFCTRNGQAYQTYPRFGYAKTIPGDYFPHAPEGGVPLHRIRTGSVAPDEVYTANVNEKNWACRQLPQSVYDPAAGQQCDEYPFASVAEGASHIEWDYSVEGVSESDNKCAGLALQHYYRIDRILRSYRDDFGILHDVDGFYVNITDDAVDEVPGDCLPLLPGEGDDSGGPGPVNLAPTVDAGPDVSGDEGAPVQLGGSASDPEGADLLLSWQATPGAGVDAGATCSVSSTVSLTPSVMCTDDGPFTLTLTANDGVHVVSDSATLTLSNVAPGLGAALTAAPSAAVTADEEAPSPETPGVLQPQPWQVFRAGTEVSLVARYSEPGTNDTHGCRTDWDDGTTSTYAPTDLTCRTSHVFEHPGMYTIETEVLDDDTGLGTAEVLVIVYDPDAGFATGGGLDDADDGRVHFQLNPKYHPQEEGPAPSLGKVRYQIAGTSFDLESTALEWLVVTPGDLVAVKGLATVDDEDGYGFVLYGDANEPDRLRLTVWPTGAGSYPTDTITYDSSSGADFDLDRAELREISQGTVHVVN